MAVKALNTDKDTTNMMKKDEEEDDNNNDDHDDTHDRGVQIRISFHLATEYQNVIPSLQVPNDIIAVPADISRKGLSTIINHLLDRSHDDDDDDDDKKNEDMDDSDNNNHKLPPIPFEFMLGNHTNRNNSSKNSMTAGLHRLFRSSGGLEREVRKLGLSLEEAIPITYFPAQLPPERMETEEEPTLPDWISTMECIDTTSSTSSSTSISDENNRSKALLCTGCYDGSIVVLDVTSSLLQSNMDDDTPLIPVATKSMAHHGPIHCMSTTMMMKDDIWMASGSMDHSLRIHILSKNQQPPAEEGGEKQKKNHSSYVFHENFILDCCINGHRAAISSIDTMTTTESDSSMLFYMASGDYDGNVGVWEHHSNNNDTNTEEDENDETEVPKSSKKSKSNSTTKKSKETSTTTSSKIMKKISTKHIFRAHTSQVSGVAFGNYEKVQSKSSSSSSSSSLQRPKQLITGSWDHSIKVWDIERQDNISTINGQRVVTCLDTSYHTSGIVVTGHPDCTIRLWDTRTSLNKDASSTVSDTTFRPSHKEWVSDVKWSPTNPYQIVSTSYDGTMKLWDIRTSLPLYTIRTFPNKEKGLSVCYSRWKNDNTGSTRNNSHDGNDAIQYVFAGGTDCIVKKFKLL
jgi:ribosome biogenesis protein YTM1